MVGFGQYTEPIYKRPRMPRAQASFKHLGHLKRLFPYVRHYAKYLIVAISGMLAARFVMALQPLLIKIALDGLAVGEANLKWPTIGILAIVIARFFLFVFSRRLIRRISVAIGYDLRKRMFAHIQRQGPGFFNRFNTGDLMARTSGDIGMVRRVVSFGWVNILTMLFSFFTGLIFMVAMSPKLTLLVLIPLPIIGYTAARMSRRLFPMVREQREAMADVTSFVQENINGIRTIQAMAQETLEVSRFSDISSRYASMVFRTTRYRAFMNLVMPFISAGSPFIILGYGGYQVLVGEITIGTFVAFFAYMVMVTGPVRSMGGWLSMFTTAAAATERLYEVLDYERFEKRLDKESDDG